MTQEELREKIKETFAKADTDDLKFNEHINELMQLINQHVAEVIGEDDDMPVSMALSDKGRDYMLIEMSRNKLRAEQRKRAGLIDKSK